MVVEIGKLSDEFIIFFIFIHYFVILSNNIDLNCNKNTKKNFWKKQHDHNKNKKKDHEQSMNWEYINN